MSEPPSSLCIETRVDVDTNLYTCLDRNHSKFQTIESKINNNINMDTGCACLSSPPAESYEACVCMRMVAMYHLPSCNTWWISIAHVRYYYFIAASILF